MSSWLLKLVPFLGFLVSAVLLTFLMLLRSFEDGYTTFALTLSAILMLYSLLRMSSRDISKKLALIVGLDTGTTDASLSASSTDSLLSRFTPILVENGQSWSQASVLLEEQRLLLEGIQQRLLRWEDRVESNSEEGFAVSRRKDIVEEEEDSD